MLATAAAPTRHTSDGPSPYEHHGEIVEGIAYPAPMDDSDRPAHPTPEELAHHRRLADTDRHAHAMHPLARLTRSDLERALPRMPGLPVLYEHGGYEVGTVVHGRIDPQTGALIVVMRIRDEATRRLLRSGAARSLSPCYTITRDPATGRTDVDITEISVVRRPLLADCTVRVVASARPHWQPPDVPCWWGDSLCPLPLASLAETVCADDNAARDAHAAKVSASANPKPNTTPPSSTTTTSDAMSTSSTANATPAATNGPADAQGQTAAASPTQPAAAPSQQQQQQQQQESDAGAASQQQQQQQQQGDSHRPAHPQDEAPQLAQLREAIARHYRGADPAVILDRLVTLEAMNSINDRVESERYSRMGSETWEAMKPFAHENSAIREIQQRSLSTMFKNHHGRRVADLVHSLVCDRAKQMEQAAAAQKLIEEARSAYAMSDNARLGQLLGVTTSVAASAAVGQGAAKRRRPDDSPLAMAGHSSFYSNWKPAPATTAFQPYQLPEQAPALGAAASSSATVAASAPAVHQPTPHHVGVAASGGDPQTESYFSERGVPADGFDFLAFSQANL